MTRPTTTGLMRVPGPIRWRSGIHPRNTAAPTRMVTTPKLREVRRAKPSWNTSQGERPRLDRMFSAMPAPNTTKPNNMIGVRNNTWRTYAERRPILRQEPAEAPRGGRS